LHNIKPGVRYPATLIVTADHDDRVVPAHSFKFAATLQRAQSSVISDLGPTLAPRSALAPGSATVPNAASGVDAAPLILIRIETRAGHGAGMALAKKIDETTDELAFLAKAFGM
jgi:prolyl oligopeptidase